MRLPFTIKILFATRLCFDEILSELENKSPLKYFSGLRVYKYRFGVCENIFYVQRYSYGIDAFLDYFSMINSKVGNQVALKKAN